MRTYNVAILGATGAVGQELIKILMERNFHINELKSIALRKQPSKAFKVSISC